MTPERLEELRQMAGAIDGPKSAWMDELIEEVDRLRGPFTCQHPPEQVGGACAVCHAEWIDKATKLELQNRAYREALELIRDNTGEEDGEYAVEVATKTVGPLPVSEHFSNSEVKARLERIESGKCPDCGQKAHLLPCTEKRVCESRTGINKDVRCNKDAGHEGFHSDGYLIRWN